MGLLVDFKQANRSKKNLKIKNKQSFYANLKYLIVIYTRLIVRFTPVAKPFSLN
jgi:hypothetical protein